MRIAISNLAWSVSSDEEISTLLNLYDVDAIDVAPGKYFPDIKAVKMSDISRVREWWASRGISITGMQSLLFGTTGLNLFGDRDTQNSMLEHLDTICRIGNGLGATRLVFGSPKNRDRSALSDAQTHSVALEFFRRLGNIAARHDVMICLEPNPPCYGANFMTNSAQTAQMVADVAHPSIRMQLDTGAITINGEDPCQILSEFRCLIGHVHASEPNLITLGDGSTDHRRMASALMASIPEQIVSIEMLPSPNGHVLVAVERALKVAIKNYRTKQTGGKI